MKGRHFIFCALLATSSLAVAQQAVPKNVLAYYDAEEIQLDRQSGNVVARGNALFMLANSFISADTITFLRDKNIATAEGNVRFIRRNEEIRASRLIMDTGTQEIRLTDALFVNQPGLSSLPVVNRELLQITSAEVAFEASRAKREEEMKAELRAIREEYVAARNIQKVKRSRGTEQESKIQELQLRYSRILERLSRTSLQPNLVFDSIPEDDKKRLTDRRTAIQDVLKSNAEFANRAAGLGSIPGYMRITADVIYQNKDGNFELENANLTPCKCDTDGTPIFGITTRKGFVEPNEYATLRGTTIEVLDVPVIYTPILKFPVKSRRETGLLFPSYYASNAGDVFSQPLFIALGDHADSTVTLNNFSQRGLRADVEVRYQVNSSSQLRLYGEGIRDTKYEKDGDLQFQRDIAASRAVEESYQRGEISAARRDQNLKNIERRRGSTKTGRWYTEGSWNIPLNSETSLKTNAELVSDNRYLGDFNRDTATSQDLFTVDNSARRFLPQEAAVEHYGTNTVLSARLQKMHDLFSFSPQDTPMRVPRVEFYLLPKRYFDLPIIFDEVATWEYIRRGDSTKFQDLSSNVALSSPGEKSPGSTTQPPNSRKDPHELYFEGSRVFTQSRATLPLPSNDYVNASLGVRGTSIQYHFPQIEDLPKSNPYLTYASYEASLDIPLYSKFSLESKAGSAGHLIHDFGPRFGYDFVPDVQRHANYPLTTMYAEDFVLSHEDFYFGFGSSWTILRENFIEEPIELQRIAKEEDVGVANEDVFKSVLEQRRLNFPDDPEAIFELSSSRVAPGIFSDWAKKELTIYESQATASEFGDTLVWPHPVRYRRTRDWMMRPFSFDIRSKYNFASARTDREYNLYKPPSAERQKSDPLGEIVFAANFNASPFLDARLNFNGAWSRQYDRFQQFKTTFILGVGYGLTASVAREDVYVKVANQEVYTLNNVDTYAMEYRPKSLQWMSFLVQREVRIEEGKRLSAERENASLVRMSFTGIQDCLNIILQRRKKREWNERDSLYEIGLHINFLNHSRDLPAMSRTSEQLDNVYQREFFN